ncbi:TIGR03086 family metal-binding protein [Pseudonocardia endophytica]|uniref:Uncharacterized protein (TIGR03086 family) n=1 Tax=Pseudonocardia endophytica TaxID=401976 RepID=A0A4R1HDF1_PSEEN|nr:TIGR03086 family metal-binding protein [Pseudonocardia endophytica]TCK20074.1 uncharacterized protein (TIGR03086 family) [Pseudonocardia endophytica]
MTNETTALADPRPAFRDAVTWVAGLAAGVRADQMANPTPCSEFDVRTLLAHLLTTIRRPRAFARGVDGLAIPHVIPGIADDALAGTYAADADAAVAAWSDDAVLDRTMRVPWGEVTGRETLHGFLNEALVHGWDLAVATGQDPEADPELVAFGREAAERILAGAREHIPFDPPVEPADDAGPTERLANWSGRVTAAWR